MKQLSVYVGVDDKKIDLFEGQYVVKNGVSYNSHVILGDKIAVIDTVDASFSDAWLKNIAAAIGNKKPDYLVISHMEPDHSGSIAAFAAAYPSAKIVVNSKSAVMLGEYFPEVNLSDRLITVADGGKLELGGGRDLTFAFMPMVHWPEVMVEYDNAEKTLYSADAFGKFGARDVDEKWDDEARRYYIGIVGKYGVQVKSALAKLAALDIEKVRPLHGPDLSGDALAHALALYSKWANYETEDDGIMIAYTSVYGHTAAAARELERLLLSRGKKVRAFDLARSDWAESVAYAFKSDTLVLATTTYNGDAFPAMREFLDRLVERNYQNRKVAVIENGTWAPVASKAIAAKLEKCKGITMIGEPVKIMAALNDGSYAKLKELSDLL